MTKSRFVALIAAIALLGASAASAYTVTATLNTTSTAIANGYMDNGDGTVTADLTVGDVIAIDIWVSNAVGDTIRALFTSLAYDRSKLGFLGGTFEPPGIILSETNCTGFMCTPPRLVKFLDAPESKPNDPHSHGTGTEDWIQIVAHSRDSSTGTTATGAPGLGDYVGVVGFQVFGTSGFENLGFIVKQTPGDVPTAIESGGVTFEQYNSLLFNVPEPGTALLLGLGLMGLGAARRRA